MSRRGFWLGLLVGAIVMGLLVATAMFVIVRFRSPAAAGIYGLRGRQFGVNPRGWFYPRMPGRRFGFGALLCGPGLLLILGALVLAAVFGRHWHHHPWDRDGRCCERQPPSVSKAAEAEQEPPARSEAVDAAPEPPAEAGQGEATK
jgi:hypothetical protein